MKAVGGPHPMATLGTRNRSLSLIPTALCQFMTKKRVSELSETVIRWNAKGSRKWPFNRSTKDPLLVFPLFLPSLFYPRTD